MDLLESDPAGFGSTLVIQTEKIVTLGADGRPANGRERGRRSATIDEEDLPADGENILKEHGLDPGPEHGTETWDEFLRSHA